MVRARRAFSLAFCLAVAVLAGMLGAAVAFSDGLIGLDIVRVALLAINTAWLAWGVAVVVNGLLAVPRRSRAEVSDTPLPDDARTAVVVPICNENPVKTFSHVAAVAHSLDLHSAGRIFQIVILSDTTKDLVARQEEFCFARLHDDRAGGLDMFYRRRQENTGRKAGNIAEFIRHSGAFYKYFVVLDADSLMDASTLIEMLRRMEADPELGLLQSLPVIMHARSLFGRFIQFSAAYFAPVHARGLAELQGDDGLFWGHNAIIRTRAFAQSCGLPELSGKPPFGGHILSHDFVESALLVRNGWKVRLDPDLKASYEEGPDNVVDFARRDRRWCQGNLQHVRLLSAPGLKPWSRFFFVQGIMAYLASPIWVLFLVATLAAHLTADAPRYFSEAGLPVFPATENMDALTLFTGVLGLLIGPKLIVVLAGAVTGANRAFGGTVRVLASVLAEIACSSILAPIMMLYQVLSVMQVLLGTDGGWPSTDRDAGEVGPGEAWAAAWWICVTGCLTLVATWLLVPEIVGWIMLVAVPAILSPLLIRLTSMPAGGTLAARLGLLKTPDEIRASSIMLHQRAALSAWNAGPEPDAASTREETVPLAPSGQPVA